MNGWKRTFGIIWAGQFASLLTSSLVSYAIIFWISITTKSPEIIAWATFASFMPQVVLGVFAGVYVDRWDRKTVMIAADGFIALCTLGLVVLMLSGEMHYSYFYLLFAFRSVGSAFHTPALQASTPLIVPASELTRVAGVNQIIQSLCGIVAPVIGAALLTVMEIEYIMLFDVAGAVLAIATLLCVKIPRPERSDAKPDIRGELKECFHAIASRKGLPYIFIVFMLGNLVITPVAILFPLITTDHFGGGAYQMSIVEMLWGVGAFAGGLVLGVRRIRSNYVVLINVFRCIIGLYLIVSGLLSENGFAVFAMITVIGGLCGALCDGLFTALLQRIINPAVLGRVFSLFFSITMLPSVLGIIGSGFLASTIGISATFLWGGIMTVVIGAVSLCVPSAIRLGRNDNR